MEFSSQLNSFIVFLEVVCCFLLVDTEASCSLEDTTYPPECTCQDYTLTCDRRQLPTPSFAGIPRDVRDLTITGYKIPLLNTTDLLGGNLSHLTSLNLSSNRIQNISRDSFSSEHFPELQTLILENNQITLDINETSTEPTVIGGLASLEVLNLRNGMNETFLKKGNFSLFFKWATFRLKGLVLRENTVTLLNADLFSFESTRDLERLDLSQTDLSIILDGTFTALPNLQILDLSQNNLETITEQNVADFKTFDSNVTTVNLTGNPFACFCSLRYFIDWIKKTELVVDKEDLRCKNSGESVLEVTHLKCTVTHYDNYNKLSTQYVTLLVIFAVIGLLALIILFMRRKDIVRFCLQVRQATKEAFDSHQTHYQYSGIHHARRETADSGVASVDL